MFFLVQLSDVTTGQPCTEFNGEFPGPNCEYIVHPTLDVTSTSITYGHQYGMVSFILCVQFLRGSGRYIFTSNFNQVSQFCDDTVEKQHNKEAPTKQNVYCNGRSTWDVISNSADFRDK